MSTGQAYRASSSFIPSLEGLRAVAAFGIMLTHVAFQTGVRPDSILARFDFFVPVFFALSAFLLWRRYRMTADWRGYLWHRALRILPAYWLTVAGVFLLLPDAFGTGSAAVVANLFLAQIYVPDALAPGLTHLWSLCVEAAFYLVLPLIALALRRHQPRHRIALILTFSALSLGWSFLPFVVASPAPGMANLQIFPISYALWFAIGLIAAELEGRVFVPGPVWPYWVLALVVAWVAAQPWFGPLGLVHPTPGEFLRRVLAGAVFGALFFLPVAWGQRPGVLSSRTMRLLGAWSYGIFLWHVPMLSWVFPLLGILPFSGNFWLVLLVTVLLTVPVAAASYYFVERPVARWGRRGR
ncbi:O-acetyltransferase OatA [Corynebacterium kalinowskii]|uniref:O-acetyltransferase OatA n=1 Tax=Corynebacterium kalinowskii TaxID=2675216 RepID=A0A6B8VQV0_9CORY|nr:acyltransferase [Corynebacterium kalinowskii]QGU01136.1 O-acetyltransferase OatA [Corynebacterium kalinowskii]